VTLGSAHHQDKKQKHPKNHSFIKGRKWLHYSRPRAVYKNKLLKHCPTGQCKMVMWVRS